MERTKVRVFGIRFLWMLAAVGFGLQGVTPAVADEGPRLIRTRVFVKLWQNHSYWPPNAKEEKYDTTSWLPSVRFMALGPIPGGTQFSVDVTKPDGSHWLKLDCPTSEIAAGRWIEVETPRDPPGGIRVFTTATGVYGFTIRATNALTGQDQALFTGRFKVGKTDKSRGNPARKNVATFHVDQDWLLPLGLLYSVVPPSSNEQLVVSMWFKGADGPKAAYLFHQGKQVASTKESGDANPVVELNTFDNDAGDPRWVRVEFKWYLANFTTPEASRDPDIFFLDKHPGDYEVKVLCQGAVCREAKFSIGPDGKFVDNGIAAANGLNSSALLLPVKVVGTFDGPWRATAWKTEAFYGNPVKGFTAP